ncbi:hypothetical protein QZH41_006436 [Actinostola sp. cb2023]|nr:hypothetical protein QZH41_006436 [Actinostola sp. cb2023]
MADSPAGWSGRNESVVENIDAVELLDHSSSHGSLDDGKGSEVDKKSNSPLNVAEECIKSFLHQGAINIVEEDRRKRSRSARSISQEKTTTAELSNTQNSSTKEFKDDKTAELSDTKSSSSKEIIEDTTAELSNTRNSSTKEIIEDTTAELSSTQNSSTKEIKDDKTAELSNTNNSSTKEIKDDKMASVMSLSEHDSKRKMSRSPRGISQEKLPTAELSNTQDSSTKEIIEDKTASSMPLPEQGSRRKHSQSSHSISPKRSPKKQSLETSVKESSGILSIETESKLLTSTDSDSHEKATSRQAEEVVEKEPIQNESHEKATSRQAEEAEEQEPRHDESREKATSRQGEEVVEQEPMQDESHEKVTSRQSEKVVEQEPRHDESVQKLPDIVEDEQTSQNTSDALAVSNVDRITKQAVVSSDTHRTQDTVVTSKSVDPSDGDDKEVSKDNNTSLSHESSMPETAEADSNDTKIDKDGPSNDQAISIPLLALPPTTAPLGDTTHYHAHLPPPPAPLLTSPPPVPYIFNPVGHFNPPGGGFPPQIPVGPPHMGPLGNSALTSQYQRDFDTGVTMDHAMPPFQMGVDQSLHQHPIGRMGGGHFSNMPVGTFSARDTEGPKATNGNNKEPARTEIVESAAIGSPVDMDLSSPEVDIIEKMNEEFWQSEQRHDSTLDEAYEPEMFSDSQVQSRVTGSPMKKTKKEHKKHKSEEQPKTKVQVLLDKLHRQARVEEEVKLVLKEYYKHREIDKNEYKSILRKAVPQVANSNHSIDPERIRSLVKKYVAKTKGAPGFRYGDLENISDRTLVACRRVINDCKERLQAQLNIDYKAVYRQLEIAYAKSAKFREAIEYHEKLLELAIKERDKTSKGYARENLGFAFQAIGKFDEAKRHYNAALETNRVRRDNEVEKRTQQNLGKLHQTLCEYDAAIKCYRKALIVVNTTHDKKCAREVYESLGIVYQAKGAYDMAIKYHKVNFNLLQTPPFSSNIVAMKKVTLNLAKCCEEKQDYIGSLNYHKAHFKLLSTDSDPKSDALASANIGHAYRLLGKNQDACKWYKNVLRFEEVNDDDISDLVHDAFENLGDLYLIMQHYDTAFTWYEKSLAKASGNRKREMKAFVNLGRTYQSKGSYLQAINKFEKALRIDRDMGNEEGQEMANAHLGMVFLLQRNHEKAIHYHQQALNIATAGDSTVFASSGMEVVIKYHERALGKALINNDKEAEVSSNYFLGVVYQSLQGEHRKALEYYQASNKHVELICDRRSSVYYNLGTVCASLDGMSLEVIEYYNKYVHLSCDQDEKMMLKAFENLGDAYGKLDRYREAIKMYNKALTKTESNDEVGEKVTWRLGELHQALSEHEKAMEYFNKALRFAQTSKKKRKLYDALGDSAKSLEKFEEAVQWFEKSLKVSKDMRDEKNEWSSYANLGGIQALKKSYDEAIRYYKNSMKILEKSPQSNKENISHMCETIAFIYRQKREYQLAIDYYKRAKVIARESGEKEFEVNVTSQLGVLCRLIGNYKEALQYHKEEREIAKKIYGKDSYAILYGNIGKCNILLEKYDEAKINFENQLALSRKQQRNRAIEADALQNLGNLYLSQQKYGKAIEYFEKFRKITLTKNDMEILGKGKIQLGQAYQKLAESYREDNALAKQKKKCLIKSIEQLKDGLKHWDQDFQNFRSQTHYEIYFQNAQELTMRYIEINEPTNALMACEQGRVRQLRDDMTARYNCQSSDEFNVMDVMTNGDFCALVYSLTNEGLMIWSLRREDQEPSYIKVTSEDENLTTACEQYIKSFYDELGVRNIVCENRRLDSQPEYQDENSSSDNEHNIELPQRQDTVRDTLPVQQTTVRDTLPVQQTTVRDTLPVQQTTVRDTLPVQQTTVRDTLPVQQTTVRDTLPVQQTTVRDTLPVQQTTVREEVSQTMCMKSLFEKLISPVEDKLTKEEIVIVPDGPLHMLPFAALKDNSGKYLSETKRIRIAPSLLTLKILSECPKDYHNNTGALVIGGPEIGQVLYNNKLKDFESLTSAKEEGEKIAKLLNSEPLIGCEATMDTVKERLGEQAQIIHIAAHGGNGKIAFAPSVEAREGGQIPEERDYILTMEEVQKIGVKAKLVVLSCCHSGRGDISSTGEVMSMSRSFIAAGARAVIASLWAVNDDITLDFMKTFYTLLKTGKSINVSLHQAMGEIRKRQESCEPKFWAPFIHIGDDVTLSFGQ